MSAALKQFSIRPVTPRYWRVTFDHPPVNLANHDTVLELQSVLEAVEAEKDLRVVVLDSANPEYYLARYDLAGAPETMPRKGPSGLPLLVDLTTRLSRTPVISIASVRGRARGLGNELVLACDLRFASREKALFGQPELPGGILPGGGGVERLPLLVGRARALEIILGGDDFDAPTAERYGWINRCVADAELDGFVDALARRIASFEGAAIAEAKRLVNRHGLPSTADLVETQDVFLKLLGAPATRARMLELRKRAAAVGPAEFERRLGHYMGLVEDPPRAGVGGALRLVTTPAPE
jgi:enoyl-CoA hydratase/carnithine racemase